MWYTKHTMRALIDHPKAALPRSRREQTMTVDTLLRKKQGRIIAISQNASATAAAKLLRAENIGAVVVKDSCSTEGDVVLGMLSERDILAALVRYGTNAMNMSVGALMTRSVVSCRMSDQLDYVAELMHRHQIRHVAVMDREAVVGVISIRDLLPERRGLGVGCNEAALG
jgi:CBS domain-containing protein